MPSPSSLVHPLRAEQPAEGLPRQQHPARHVGLELERRLGRQRHDLRRPVDQQQRAPHGSGILDLDDHGTGRNSGEGRQEALAVIVDAQRRRRRRRLARDRQQNAACVWTLTPDRAPGPSSAGSVVVAPGRQEGHAPNQAAQEVEKPVSAPGRRPSLPKRSFQCKSSTDSRVGVVERQAPQLRRDREGDLDEVIEVGLAVDTRTGRRRSGVFSVRSVPKLSSTMPGMGTEHVPMHVEQPGARRVEEEVDGFGLGHRAVAGEGQRIDPIERPVVAAADQRLRTSR